MLGWIELKYKWYLSETLKYGFKSRNFNSSPSTRDPGPIDPDGSTSTTDSNAWVPDSSSTTRDPDIWEPESSTTSTSADETTTTGGNTVGGFSRVFPQYLINDLTEFDIKNCSQKDSIQGGSLQLKASVLSINNYYEAKCDSNHLYINPS